MPTVAGKGNNHIKRTNEKMTQEQSCSIRLIICCDSRLSFECLKFEVAIDRLWARVVSDFEGSTSGPFKGDEGSGQLSWKSNPSRLSCSWLLSRGASITSCGPIKTRSSLCLFGARTKGNKEGEGEWWNAFIVSVLSTAIKVYFKKKLFLLLCLHCCQYWLSGSQLHGHVLVSAYY